MVAKKKKNHKALLATSGVDMEPLNEQEWIDTVGCIEKLRKQYPDSVYKKTILDIVADLSGRYDKQIQKKRDEYNQHTSFFEKQKYYNEILVEREKGYALAKDRLNIFLKRPEPRPYESWVTPNVYAYMTKHGYRKTIEFYISLNQIL